MSKNKIHRPAEGVLKVIPLGGLGEIGKNMTVFEYGDDIIVVDMGSMFPHDDMPGVDLVIPDITYLRENRQRVRGYFITHGHEDHIGAAPYVLRDAPAPVYATRLTCALMGLKFKEHRMMSSVEMHEVEPSDTIVAPTTICGIFSRFAIATAASTNLSPATQMRPSPTRNSTMVQNRESGTENDITTFLSHEKETFMHINHA